MPPPGFKIIDNAVSEEAWEEIRSYLGLDTRKENLGIDITSSEVMNSNTCTKNRDSTSTGTSHHHNDVPWESTPVPQNRSVAQFGFRYDYEEDIVIPQSKVIASTRDCGTSTGNNSSCSEENMNRNDTDTDTDTDAASKDEDVPDIPEIFNRLLIRPMGKFQFQFVKEEKETLESEMQSDSDSIEFTQCIINVYRPCDHGNAVNDVVKSSAGTCTTDAGVNCSFNSGSHIPWHVDDLKFGPTIVVYTFGDDDNHPIRPLHMRSSLNSVQFNSEEQINKDADVQVHVPVGIVDREDDRYQNAGGGTKVNLDSGRSSDTEYCYYTSHPRHCSCYILSGEARYDWEHSVPTGSGWRVSITFRTFHSD